MIVEEILDSNLNKFGKLGGSVSSFSKADSLDFSLTWFFDYFFCKGLLFLSGI